VLCKTRRFCERSCVRWCYCTRSELDAGCPSIDERHFNVVSKRVRELRVDPKCFESPRKVLDPLRCSPCGGKHRYPWYARVGALFVLSSCVGLLCTPWHQRVLVRTVDGSDVFGLGCGLMQTAAALAKLSQSDLSLRGFGIKVPNQAVGAGTQTDRGVYWRDASRSATALFEDDEHETLTKGNEDKEHDVKLAFEMRVGLVR
jgi:hypothetical protein